MQPKIEGEADSQRITAVGIDATIARRELQLQDRATRGHHVIPYHGHFPEWVTGDEQPRPQASRLHALTPNRSRSLSRTSGKETTIQLFFM